MAVTQEFCSRLEIAAEICALVLNPDEQDFAANSAREAGHFSSFSGFLAALAFASLMILITNPPAKDAAVVKDRVQEAFTISMFSLAIVFTFFLLSTFLFIPITGSAYRPEQELGYLIAHTLLALAVCELFLSLSWFFVAYRLSVETWRASIVIFFFVVFVVTLNISAVLVNVEINLQPYYLDQLSSAPAIHAKLAGVGLPIAIGGLVRATIHRRIDFAHWQTFTHCLLYASMVFTLVLVSSYVYLFSGLWDRNQFPFPNHSGDALLVAQGLILASCILALPNALAENEARTRV